MNGVVSGINPADSFTRISPIGQAAYHAERKFPVKFMGLSTAPDGWSIRTRSGHTFRRYAPRLAVTSAGQ
ncbi:hypothetical protein CU280_02620 [Yersinia mollaretii]|nr:hypothetical protein CU280_02620 [Yersinia mollaretii]